MGILPRHEPIVTTLRPGTLEIVRGESRDMLAIGGGFMEVRASHVVVMADVAEHAEEIDLARAEEARERAQRQLQEAPERVDMEAALAALRRAEVRIKVARRGAGRRREPPVMRPPSAPEA
jgi:F-type H+-transporting ATPase subunit epsilon